MIQFPEIAAGQSMTGEMSSTVLGDLQKALTAGYGTDVSQLTGGSALRIQSLDKTMQATIQENKHFRLFNELPKPQAGATVDEWTEQSGVGGFLGGSTNTETGIINEATGQYARRVGLVKYLMTKRQVSLVSTLGNNLASSEAIEQQAGAKQLLTDAEYLCFDGDDAVVPTEFSGIFAQIAEGVKSGQVDGDNVLDAEASPLASVNLLNKAASHISNRSNFGTPTHLFMSNSVQADFDTGLDPAFRVPLPNVPNGGIMLGAPVNGIRTSWGDIKACPDVFIGDGDSPEAKPFELHQPVLAAQNAGMKPTIAAVAASDTGSKFGAAHAGNYYYLVTGVNANGQSTGVISAQVAVAAGNKVTLTITASAGNQETGYAIYRSRQNGTNAPSDFRLMTRVAKAGATTTYVDLNRDIPGTSKAYVLNMNPGDHAINWRQLLPMMKFPLYPTNAAVLPWAQLMFGYLRITKRRQHVVIKNILSPTALWRPFAA
jgi:hypothetical protein